METNKQQAEPTHQPDKDRISEAEALLLTLATIVGELKQPLTVILGLSDLLLAQVEPEDPLATDLTTIAKQANRMGEIINGVDYLTQY